MVINIDLDNKYEYVNLYDDNKLNDDLCNYIIGSVNNSKDDIRLRVKFNYNIEEDINIILNKFRGSFKNKLNEIDKLMKKENIRDIILLILGFIFLGIYCYLDDFNIFLVAELFMVISWVLFWEFAESILFKRKKLVDIKGKYKKLESAMIEVSILGKVLKEN